MSSSKSIRKGTTLVRCYKFVKIKSLLKKSSMEEEFLFIICLVKINQIKRKFIRVNGIMTRSPVLDFRDSLMALSIMVTITITSLMVGGSLPIPSLKYMKVNGKMESRKGKDFGKVSMVKTIWENGKVENHKVMEFLLLKMAIDMKANTKMHLNMDKELKDLSTVIFTKVFSKTEYQAVMVSITGKTKAILRVTSQTVCEQDKDYGKELLEILINTKVSTKMIRNGVMEYLHGQMVTCLREHMKAISEMGMGKCSGLMEAITKDCGKMESKMEKVFDSFN